MSGELFSPLRTPQRRGLSHRLGECDAITKSPVDRGPRQVDAIGKLQPRQLFGSTVDEWSGHDPAGTVSKVPRSSPRHGGTALRGEPRIRDCLEPEHAACFKFETFNAVQAACWKDLYQGAGNLVLTAPTGSGKTVLFELAILGMLRSSKAKALYLAPLKALCQEKVREWKQTFGALGEDVVELTGDDERVLGKGRGAARLAKARVIVATPEMWDALMRQAERSKGFGIIEDLQLVCLDEVHMVNMPKRGALLEAVIARLRVLRLGGSQVQTPRFVAVSATVPNAADVAKWLEAEHLKTFGMDFRPVPLSIYVNSYKSSKNEFVFQESLNHHLCPVIQQFWDGKATLVFCVTKRACETAAKSLQNQHPWQSDQRLRVLLREKAASLTDFTLRSLVVDGLAYHHAGLNAKDRQIVEQLFLQSAILVLFCTQTLALGVNLPARLVIVKGTTAYKDDGWEEYDDLEMLQIMGRAGRPQFDHQGVAVIMTENASRWQQIIAGRPLESKLPANLTEALLAEVVAQTTPHLDSLCSWLKSSFLAVRCERDPGRYAALCPLDGAHPLLSSEGPDVEKFLEALSHKELNKLMQAGLITCQGTALEATALGEVASRFSVRYETIRWLQQAPAPSDLKELLWLIAQSADFEEFRPKHGEKTQLRDLARKDGVRWPLTGPVDSAAKKVLVLVMLALADSPRRQLPWELKNQQSQVLRRAEPLLRVVSELFETRKEGRALATCMLMRNCLRKQIWENSSMLVRQLPNIGDVGAQTLKERQLSNLEALLSGDPRAIENALGRRPPFGSTLQRKLRAVPLIKLHLSPKGTDGTISINLVLAARPPDAKVRGNESQFGTGFVHCLAYVAPSGQLMLHRRFPAESPQHGMALNLQNSTGLAVHLIYEDFIGFDDFQVIGDARVAVDPSARATHISRSPGHAGAVASHGSKRQKVAACSGHEATFALARGRQGAQIQTLASSFATPGCPTAGATHNAMPQPMPGFEGGSNGFKDRGFCGQPREFQAQREMPSALPLPTMLPMQPLEQPSLRPNNIEPMAAAMPPMAEACSDSPVEQPDTVMIRTAAGRLRRVSKSALAAPSIQTQLPSNDGKQFLSQFVRASDMLSSAQNSVHDFAFAPPNHGLWGFAGPGGRR